MTEALWLAPEEWEELIQTRGDDGALDDLALLVKQGTIALDDLSGLTEGAGKAMEAAVAAIGAAAECEREFQARQKSELAWAHGEEPPPSVRVLREP